VNDPHYQISRWIPSTCDEEQIRFRLASIDVSRTYLDTLLAQCGSPFEFFHEIRRCLRMQFSCVNPAVQLKRKRSYNGIGLWRGDTGKRSFRSETISCRAERERRTRRVFARSWRCEHSYRTDLSMVMLTVIHFRSVSHSMIDSRSLSHSTRLRIRRICHRTYPVYACVYLDYLEELD
jgi:hypothetical protein